MTRRSVQPRHRSLLWNRNFRLVWIGETVSDLGDSVANVAAPLVAVSILHSSALGVSTLVAVTYLPYLLLGLPAGAWVDRLPSRLVMITCDVVQFLLFFSLFGAWLWGVLTLVQLACVTFLAGTAQMMFSSAYNVYLALLLSGDDLIDGNAKLQGSSSVSRVVGPGLSGLVSQFIGPVAALLLNSFSFLCSAGCVARTERMVGEISNREYSNRGTVRADIAEGLKLVFKDRYLRLLISWAALANFGLAGYFALIVPFLVRSVRLSSGLVGAMLTMGGLGGVLGALVARRLCKRFGTARTLASSCIVSAALGLLIVATRRGLWLTAGVTGIFALEGGIILGTVILASFRQSYVDPRAVGRVNTTMRMVTYGVAPFGALMAGFLGDVFGGRAAITVMLVIDIASSVLLLGVPLRGMRNLPQRQ